MKWEKVRGRFWEFILDNTETDAAYIVGQVLAGRGRESRTPMPDLGESDSGLPILHDTAFMAAARKCGPLHPMTVVLLYRLSKLLGQQDRTVVGWLTSSMDTGFEFAASTPRLKRRIRYRVVERRPANRAQGATSDQTIVFTSARGRRRCPHRLRRIGCRDPETGRHYVFPTTNFKLSAKTVADVYKSRREVDLFFKWIKQNLRIKSFVGTSRNAVTTQPWIALCVCLLLAYVKFANRLAWSMREILRLMQLNLFERRPLLGLLEPDTGPPPRTAAQLQLAFC